MSGSQAGTLGHGMQSKESAESLPLAQELAELNSLLKRFISQKAKQDSPRDTNSDVEDIPPLKPHSLDFNYAALQKLAKEDLPTPKILASLRDRFLAYLQGRGLNVFGDARLNETAQPFHAWPSTLGTTVDPNTQQSTCPIFEWERVDTEGHYDLNVSRLTYNGRGYLQGMLVRHVRDFREVLQHDTNTRDRAYRFSRVGLDFSSNSNQPFELHYFGKMW
jgi:hypothetical protein